jgi:hypothetical protein
MLKIQKQMSENCAGLSAADMLIVIGLVLLAGLAITVFVDPINIQKRNRDIIRLENMDAVNRAIHLGVLEGEIVLKDTKDCENCNSLKGSTSVEGNGWVVQSTTSGKKGLKKYIDELPVDPVNKPPLIYKFVSSDAQGYKLAVPLESVEHKVKMRVDGGIYDDLYEIGTDMSLEF